MKYKDKNIIYVYSIMKIIDNSPEVFRKNIPHKYIIVDKPKQDEERKAWIKGNSKHSNWTLEQAIKEHEKYNKRGEICCKFDMKNTPFCVFDVDTDDVDIDDFCEDLNISENDTVWVKGNTKGFHLWVVFNEDDYKKPSEKNIVECMNNCKGDYLGDVVFERIDKEWNYKNSYPDLCPIMSEISEEAFSTVYDMQTKEFNKEKKNIKVKNEKVYEPSDNETLEKICDLIDPSYIEDRKGFLHLMIAMKNSGLSREYAIEFSKRSPKFDETSEMYGIKSPEDFDNFWDYADPNYLEDYKIKCEEAKQKGEELPEKRKPLTEATLHKRAKESNEEQYNLLTSWSNIDRANKSYSNLLHYTNDYDFASLFVSLIGDDLMYQPQTDKEDEKLYLYHNNQWKEDIKPHYLTRKIVFKVLSKYTIEKNIENNKLLLKCAEQENEDEWEKLRKKVKGGDIIIMELKKVNIKDSIVKAIKEELAGTENKIEFDKNPDLFSFNNKCFDLRTNMEHIPTKHDYILMRTGDDYIQPTDEQMDKIKGLVELVLPDPEVRKCYMSILRSGMRGQTLEKFTMANGCGRNGKTFLHELFMKFMGKYAIKGNVSIITQKMKSGPNPELANLNKKRFVLWAEPEENQSIQISTMKDLTGGDTITAKQCHSNKTEQINHGTHVMELNERVGFDGKLNLAVVERMLDVEFPSFFTYDPIQYNDPEFNNGHCYKRDDSLKEPKFKDEHACALFHYVMEYEGTNELYVAEAVKQRTKAYLNSKDEFTSWFNSVYKVAWNDEKDHEQGRDMKEVIKLSEVYDAYKDGDVYKNMSKKECRKMTKARFIEIFASHINFKHYHSLRTKIDGATYRNILRGFKRKGDCDNDFEEEEE